MIEAFWHLLKKTKFYLPARNYRKVCESLIIANISHCGPVYQMKSWLL